MDKIAIISDIHGNMAALEAVLAHIVAEGAETIYCLGDIIDDAASAEVLDRCRSACTGIVKGAGEHALLADATAREQLGNERVAWLDALPRSIDFYISGKRVRLLHASQTGDHVPVDKSNRKGMVALFADSDYLGRDLPQPNVVCYGATHKAFTRPLARNVLINVGSVGDPQDQPHPTYLMLYGIANRPTITRFATKLMRVPIAT